MIFLLRNQNESGETKVLQKSEGFPDPETPSLMFFI
jgi:hypothetical protein